MIDISLGAERVMSAEQKIFEALKTLDRYPDVIEADYCECDSSCGAGHIYLPMAVEDAIKDLRENVPKLIEAYAELWEMSMELIAAVEKEREGKTPSGLVIPK